MTQFLTQTCASGDVRSMSGVSSRFGVLLPSVNTIIEPDMYRMTPSRTSVHFARVPDRFENTREELVGMKDEVEKPSELLKDARVGVIAFGCTAGSFIGGVSYDQQVIRIIETKTGIRATTTATAVVSSLKNMNLEKITVATPYEEWLNEIEAKFLENNGISVLSIRGKGLVRADDQASFPPHEIVRFVRQIHDQDSDGIFISCTNFRAVEAIEKLERILRKPVISSNQATMWMLMQIARVTRPVRRYGKLLSKGGIVQLEPYCNVSADCQSSV
jgi:maleate isomerase